MQACFSRMGAYRWIINHKYHSLYVNRRDFAAFVLEERFRAYTGGHKCFAREFFS
jgi:hypothetical protein